MVRIAINGFGRIGRMVFRAGHKDPDFDVVAINDLTDTRTLAHLLRDDSVHGLFEGDISYTDHSLIINGMEIAVLAVKDPKMLPWKEMNIDVVIESTGIFRSKEKAGYHLTAGARKVLISAPAKGSDPVKTIVKGVNEHMLESSDTIISCASCTTNCLAPIVKVLDDNYGVEEGFMTTVHSYTADQRLVDSPHSDLRRARSAAMNIVPTSTGAAKAVTEVIPHLKGKMDGLAMRVPTPDGSITDFVCRLKKCPSKDDINTLFKGVSERELKGVLQYTDEPIVSSDIVGNRHSSIFDASCTMVFPSGMIKVISWYDNEMGYSCRMVDLAKMMAR